MQNRSISAIALLLFGFYVPVAMAQTIDFETLPSGEPTVDNMLIDAQYEAEFGVRFSLIDPTTGAKTGFPRIAKVGPPLTAFVSCQGDDTPDSGLGVGSSFLTDDGVLGNSADLLIEYISPVREASGIILDVDARSSTPGAVEGWLIRALSSSGELLESIQIFAPQGPDEPGCEGFNGEGDGSARGFSFSRTDADIASIQFSYIGNAKLGSVGLAFDNFSPAAAVEELTIEVSIVNGDDFVPVCVGQQVILSVQTTGGFSDQTIRWEERSSETTWEETESIGPNGEYYLRSGIEIRAVVDDGSTVAVSEPLFGFGELGEGEYTVVIEAPGGNPETVIETAALFLFSDTRVEEIWGDDPTSFDNGEIATVSEGVHVVPMLTINGTYLALIYNTTGGSTPGTVKTEINTFGFEPSLVFVDDPDDPMYNDTYTEKLLAPGMKRITLDQTWAGDKTDGFIVGPLAVAGLLTISFTESSGLSTGLIFNGDGDPVPFDYVNGLQLTFENSCSESCIADLNDDGVLNFFDVSTFLAAFQASEPLADFNGDGLFNFFDVSAFLTAFNGGCP